MPRSILISEPNAANGTPYLPYVWATLKTASEKLVGIADQFRWLDPIYETAGATDLLSAYDLGQVQVLGLSCYTWNFALQCQIARIVKTANPRCLVVAGGPDPDIKNADFFRRHPYIDVVVSKDGELTFGKILIAIARHGRLFDVTGLYLPYGERREVVSTGPPELPTRFEHSPYHEQSKYFEALIAKHAAARFNAVWETNRGCPYSCSFCDWGSSTMSKIRQFDLARVKMEAEWLARMRLNFVFLADANFGILPRDLEIADALIDAHLRRGNPRYLYYSPAKNNPDRALAIAQRFARSGLSSRHTLAIQHTDPAVLASTERANISALKQRDVARTLLDAAIPVDVQLILGIPGDSYPRWKRCFADLMEWGIHEEYFVFFYSLLPNAPAAEPRFIARWNMKTILRRTRFMPAPVPRSSTDGLLVERIVVQSRSFTFHDWVRMNVYTTFVRALHGLSLTRMIAIYLRHTHGISYQQFYDSIIESFFADTYAGRRLYLAIEDCYGAALEKDVILNQLELEELPDFPHYVTTTTYLFFKLCWRCAHFYEQLSAFLCTRFPDIDNLKSIVDYQENLVILPSYDARQGKIFAAAHDWPNYFRSVAKGAPGCRTAEPAPLPGGFVSAHDTSCGEATTNEVPIDWWRVPERQRWHDWLLKTAFFRTARSHSNLRVLEVHAALPTEVARPELA